MLEWLNDLRSRLANRPRERSNAYVVKFRRVTIDAQDYYLPRYALHRPACQEFLNGRLYEPDTHEQVSKLLAERGGDIVHAGTFFGDMLPSFSQACRGTVYAFEPVLENYVLAKLCVEKNALRNVALFNAGLSDRLAVGHVDTGSRLHSGGGSQISQSGQMTTLMTIDSLGLDHLSVLHLDVEGYERHALKGAERTIAKCRPIVLIEDYKKTCPDYLGSLDYTLAQELPELEIWVPESTGKKDQGFDRSRSDAPR